MLSMFFHYTIKPPTGFEPMTFSLLVKCSAN